MLKARGIELSFARVIAYYYVGLFFNNFLVGYIGGDAFRIYDVRKVSHDTSGAVSAVTFDRFIGFFVLTTMGLIAAIVGFDLVKNGSIILSASIIFIGWMLTIIFLFKKNFARKFMWFFNLILPTSLRIKMREIYLGINSYGQDKKILLKVLTISILTQSLRILTHYFAAYAVGVRTSLVYFWIYIPVIALASSLPVSLGGIGVREQSGVVLFNQIGLSSTQVAAFEFLAYIVGIFATIPGGLIFAFRSASEKSAEMKFTREPHPEGINN